MLNSKFLIQNYFVIRSGFEPETHSLEGCCSIQLSYQTLAFSKFAHRLSLCDIRRSMPPPLIQTHEVWVSFLFLHAKIPM